MRQNQQFLSRVLQVSLNAPPTPVTVTWQAGNTPPSRVAEQIWSSWAPVHDVWNATVSYCILNVDYLTMTVQRSIKPEVPLDSTPHLIHPSFSFSFMLASPRPSLHLLSDGSITPCSPQLPLASSEHVLLTSCVTAGSENRSSVSSSSWKSVRSGGGWLAVSAMFASALDADDSYQYRQAEK